MVLVLLPLDISKFADSRLDNLLILLIQTQHRISPQRKSLISYIRTARISMNLFLICGKSLQNVGLGTAALLLRVIQATNKAGFLSVKYDITNVLGSVCAEDEFFVRVLYCEGFRAG